MSAAPKLDPQGGESFSTSDNNTYEPAGNNKRVIAFIIDGMIVTTTSALFQSLVINSLFKTETMAFLVNLAFQLFLLPVFYWVYLTIEFGATPGKKMMGLKIVNVDHSLELSIGKLIFRELVARWASILTIGLGYVWVSFNKDRKTFHDMIAKTRVVEFK